MIVFEQSSIRCRNVQPLTNCIDLFLGSPHFRYYAIEILENLYSTLIKLEGSGKLVRVS